VTSYDKYAASLYISMKIMHFSDCYDLNDRVYCII